MTTAKPTVPSPLTAGYPATYSRDAHLLAEDAHEFTARSRAGRAAMRTFAPPFERVSRSYHLVRDEVDHSDSRVAREDLRPVTESYLDLERAMGGYPDRRERDYRASERR